jgi:thiamine-monophosphate kinase
LYVTGTLGGPRAALDAWENQRDPAPEHRARFARPSARIREALWLAERGATAAIDISDGLVSDVRHLVAASRMDAGLEIDAIPVVGGVSPLEAVRSGEEYELVVAAPVAIDQHAFAREFGVPLTRLGSMSEPTGPQPTVRLLSHGSFVDLPPGHDHFSR